MNPNVFFCSQTIPWYRVALDRAVMQKSRVCAEMEAGERARFSSFDCEGV